jgi:hypothetical protein
MENNNLDVSIFKIPAKEARLFAVTEDYYVVTTFDVSAVAQEIGTDDMLEALAAIATENNINVENIDIICEMQLYNNPDALRKLIDQQTIQLDQYREKAKTDKLYTPKVLAMERSIEKLKQQLKNIA